MSAGSATARRLAPEAKLVATVAFTAVVVATPAGSWPALVVHGLLLVVVACLARVPPSWALPRMGVEIPVVAFAVALPFVAAGDRMAWGPLTVSRPGFEAALLLVARATLGVAAAVLLASMTPAADLLAALERLRAPAAIVAILGAMLRFGGVVADDARRMGVAIASRGGDAGRARAWRAVGAAIGRLFVRSYERGERVQLAMASRGHPGVRRPPPPAGGAVHWATCLTLPAVAGLATAVAG